MPERITDFHAHILPGADHGSESLDTSLAQLRLLKNAGVTDAVATPHFYPERDSVSAFLKRREDAAALLSGALTRELPRVYVGAEVLVCPGMERMEGLQNLCIRGTNVLLLEMPFARWNEKLYETVYNISRTGVNVVMAHINRYPEKAAQRLVFDCGVSAQLNSECFASRRGKKLIMKWLDSGCVTAFGSDIHGSDKSAAASAARLRQMTEKTGEAGESVMRKSNALLTGAVPLK